MGDILTKCYLKFDKENKEKVLKLIKDFDTNRLQIRDKEIEFESWNTFEEEDFKDLKLFCVDIECWEYEDLGSSIIWNSGDESIDELKKIIKTKELEGIK